MREIKFRAWDKEEKRWVNINHIVNDWSNSPYINTMCVTDNTTFELNEAYGSVLWSQYTGLKDKNGKEIYEGDIVKWDYLNAVAEVKFGSYDNGENYEDKDMGNGWYISGKYTDEIFNGDECIAGFGQSGNSYEVIGNIYENPELLKGGTDGR